MNDLERALEEQKRQNQQEVTRVTGLLGVPISGQRRVEVPNRNAYVFVRLRSNQSEVIQAFNNQVATSYDLPVIVERHGNKYIVVGVDNGRYENNWGSNSSFVPRHGNAHSFDLEAGGGGDVVWVQSRQIVPLLPFPSGSVGAANVIVHPYTLRNSDGTWRYVGNTGTANLTPYLPTSPTGAIMALLYLDTNTGNPQFLIGSGSVFSNSITGSSQVLSFVPPLTNPGKDIPLAAIRLITGTNQISWNNIYDLRQWLHTIPTGSAGGGGGVGIQGIPVQDEGVFVATGSILNFVGDPVSVTASGSVIRVFITGSASGGSINTGTLDARYLKLDASNDPVTDALRIESFNGGEDALTVVQNYPDSNLAGLQVNSTSGSYGSYFLARNNWVLLLDQIFVGAQTITKAALDIFRYPGDSSVRNSTGDFILLTDSPTGTNHYGSTLRHKAGSNVTLVDLHPYATGTLPSYIFDTAEFKPTGTVHTSFRVASVERARIDVSGTVYSNNVPLIKEAPVDGSSYVRKNAGWEVAAGGTSGQSVLGAAVTLTGTTATYQEITGIPLSLPSAGTYMIFGSIRGAISSSAAARIQVKLRNDTDAADIADSETLVVFQATTSTIAQNSVSLVNRIEVDGPKTIKLLAARVFTAAVTVSEISADAAGKTRLSYLKVG